MGKGTPEKPLKREFSAGGVVFRKEDGTVFWLVTQHNPSERMPDPIWRLPKGWIDNKSEDTPGEVASGLRRGSEKEIQKAALREVREEGGIEARIVKKLQTIKFFFRIDGDRILKFVTFYLMEWQLDLKGGLGKETRAVEWLLFDEACRKLKYSSEKAVLKEANEALGHGIQESLV